MNHKLGIFAVLILISTFIILAACGAILPETSSAATMNGLLLPMVTDVNGTSVPCAACAQATLEALQTQEKSNSDAQAAATAAIMRANAQATLNAVSSTLSAAQTQEKNNANIVAAQVAATAEIQRANAQATLVAAGSTQGAAQTQDAIRQTEVQSSLQVTADLATQNAFATQTQQNNNNLAGNTQTAVANQIATQTQSAVATTQWYADQERQRAEQRQGPLTFLWMWCPPLFIIALGFVGLLFFWRWMSLRETQQRIDSQPGTPRVGDGTDAPLIIEHEPRPNNSNNQYALTKPTDHVRKWLEEVKRKVITSQKDDHDKPGS